MKGKNTVGKRNKYHKKLGEKLILLPALGLATLSGAVVLGATPNSFAATSATDSDTTLVTVTVGSVISITADDINIDMSTPSPTGSFATGTGNVVVKTNDISGYSVYLTSNSASTTLDHESLSTAKINSIGSDITIDASTTKFSTNNTWGWSNDGSLFHPVVAKGTKHSSTVTTLYRKTSAPSTAGDTSTLTVGVTADSSLTSGKYTGTLLLTAIPNGSTDNLKLADSTI